GIGLMLHAVEGLRSWHGDNMPRAVTILLVSDEEVGSDSSRRITESMAKNCAPVLVLEPAFGLRGALKTSRKGVGEYRVKVIGKAAHSGLDFEKGQSAILELARQIVQISKLVDVKRGTTMNVGVVSGGIRTLDGLGGVGEGAHAAHESILISELPRRAALLAQLIESV